MKSQEILALLYLPLHLSGLSFVRRHWLLLEITRLHFGLMGVRLRLFGVHVQDFYFDLVCCDALSLGYLVIFLSHNTLIVLSFCCSQRFSSNEFHLGIVDYEGRVAESLQEIFYTAFPEFR